MTKCEKEFTLNVTISESAAKAVRLSFNPSGEDDVNEVKELTAALITKCQNMAKADPEVGREVALAVTLYETACMRAVRAVTQHLA